MLRSRQVLYLCPALLFIIGCAAAGMQVRQRPVLILRCVPPFNKLLATVTSLSVPYPYQCQGPLLQALPCTMSESPHPLYKVGMSFF